MKITFNTGRLYTKEGQVVSAQFDECEEKIWFNDHSRGVWGCIDAPNKAFRTPGGLADYVMARYDRHEYKMDMTSGYVQREAEVHHFRL
jgi:hypothetical protein